MSKFLHLWYQALDNPPGVCFEVNNFASIKQQLYTARKDSGDETISDLRIVQSPINPNHLWILHPKAKKPKVELAELKL